MRKLASIQRIKNLEPIEGADAIVKATVLGWSLVVKKDEFKINDLCVYVEIDSLLPEKTEFEFLRKMKFRIKTVKLRGQVSQGICFPLSILSKSFAAEEGMDVTEELGVVKYEPPVPDSIAGVKKAEFPSFIPKTDETRVQVMQDELSKHKGKEYYITEKLDGTSVTFFIKDGGFGVCSRNMELVENADSVYWQTAKHLAIEDKLRSLNRNVAIQGELVGESIQGNKLKLKGNSVFFFTLFWIDEYKYAGYDEWKEVFGVIGLETVPVLEKSFALADDIDVLLKMAERKSVLNADVLAEGIVIRVKIANELVSFKAINNKFLLSYDE
ncbi:MAG: RNA ligase (ATP) [Chitinophagaceae bacterium]|nr:RNA ligase (ATP) [Chitinophagaceae bacterium]